MSPWESLINPSSHLRGQVRRRTSRWMRRGQLPVALMVMAILAGLAGCALPLLERPAQTDKIHTYTLAWEPATPAPAAPAQGPTLLIASPLPAPGYAGNDMIYMDDPLELKEFAWHRWADAPARLLEPLLLTAAEQTGLFRTVVPAGTPGETDLRLETRLRYLRQVFEGDHCRVEMALRATLVDNRSARILGSRDLREALPCTSPDPRGGAIAANQIVARLMEHLQDFLRSRLKRP